MDPLSQAKAENHKLIQTKRMQDSTESLVKTIKSELNQAYFGTPPGRAGRQDKPDMH